MNVATTFKAVRRLLEKRRSAPLWNDTNHSNQQNHRETRRLSEPISRKRLSESTNESEEEKEVLQEPTTDARKSLSFEFVREILTERLPSKTESAKQKRNRYPKAEELPSDVVVKLLKDVVSWKEMTKRQWIDRLKASAASDDSNETEIQCPLDVLDFLETIMTPTLLSGLNILFKSIIGYEVNSRKFPCPRLDVEYSEIPISIFVPSSTIFESDLDIPLFDSKSTPQSNVVRNPIWRPCLIDGILIPISSTNLNRQFTRLLLSFDSLSIFRAQPMPLALFNAIICPIKQPKSNILELPSPPHNIIERLDTALNNSEECDNILSIIKIAWGIVDPPPSLSTPAFLIPVESIPVLNFNNVFFY